jgi:photosystem II stability/assembly factor-like uncharacterized protein
MTTRNLFLLICSLIIFSYSVGNLPASDIWESLGPESGSISAIACAKTDTQIIYVATGDGVYKSVNGGKSWQRSCNGLGSLSASSLVINGDVIYVGTTNGVYKSVDAGETWELSSERLIEVTCLAISPTDPNVIYAAVGIAQSEIFKSMDYGESWSSVDGSLGKGRFYSIAVHPQNSDVIYVARENTFIEQNTQEGWNTDDMGLISTEIWCVAVSSRGVYVSTSIGVFRSNDSCKNFSMISSGLPPNITIITIAQPDIVYVYSPRNGIYKSDEGGNNWQLLTDNLNIVKCLTFVSPDTLYAGTQGSGIYKSADGGKTWGAINNGLRNFDVLSFVCSNTNEIYVSSKYGGLYKSFDGGNSWRSLRLDGLLVEDIMVQRPGIVYATIDSGLYKSANGGNGWEQITAGPADVITFDLAMCPSKPSTIYAATWGDGIYRSDDYGKTWTGFNEGLIDKRVSSIEIAPSDNEVLYAQTYLGILHSSKDAGESWNRIESPVAGNEIFLLAIAPGQAGTIYVRADDSMFKSVNFGRNFSKFPTPQNSVPLALAIDKFKVETLYLGARDAISGECKIYKSIDNGRNWSPTGDGFPNVIVNTLSIHPVNTNIIYAGASGGVFRLVQGGIPNKDAKIQISNVINYPNPFAPSKGTTFRYMLSRESLVTIKIFNMAGTFIRTIIKDVTKISGIQEDIWDGRDEYGNLVSFGMYIYKITATSILDESNVSTISKVLLVKP